MWSFAGWEADSFWVYIWLDTQPDGNRWGWSKSSSAAWFSPTKDVSVHVQNYQTHLLDVY